MTEKRVDKHDSMVKIKGTTITFIEWDLVMIQQIKNHIMPHFHINQKTNFQIKKFLNMNAVIMTEAMRYMNIIIVNILKKERKTNMMNLIRKTIPKRTLVKKVFHMAQCKTKINIQIILKKEK